jgi:HEAT repeat protein
MELNQNDDDLPEAPDLAELPTPDAAPIRDDDALKKMGSRTPPWAWIAFGVLLLGAGAIGALWWQQNQAFESRWDAYNAAQTEAQGRDDFLRRIRELLPQSAAYEDVQVRILQKMAQYRDASSVPQITACVESERPTVRIAAARALAAIGSPGADPAKPVLLRTLPNTDVADRAAVVWALAVLGESSAADAIIAEFSSGRLQGQPDFDPHVISTVLGRERLSSNSLLNHDELSVRTLTAAALAELATPEVVDPLSRMVDFELQRQEPDQNVLQSIASGLGRAGDERAGGPLFRILTSQPAMRTPVLDSLRRTVGAPGIAALLAGAQDASIRRELVRMLASGHDPRAADTLAAQLTSDDADLKKDAAMGLAELGDARGVPHLVTLAQGQDLTVAREALSRVQQLGAAESVDVLLPMLENEAFLGRRANVLRALGASGAAHAGPAIERHLEGDDVASAAMALADLNYDPAYERLLDMIPRPRDVDFSTPSVANETAYMNRTAAVRAIGRYGRAQAAEALMTIIEDPLDDRRLRQNAGFALGEVATDETLRQVLEKLRSPEVEDLAKRYYVVALWQRPSRALTNDLLDLVVNAATNSDVRRAASLAVGYAADPAGDARVRQILDDANNVAEGAFMTILGGSDDNANHLLGILGTNAELQQILLFAIRDDEANSFNLVTRSAFESGAFWRRLSVANILNEGEESNRHGYVWNHLRDRLRAGWEGQDGMTPRQIRQALWDALRGEDAVCRALVAHVLANMNEGGLLMSARDQGGPGSEEARAELRRMNAAPSNSPESQPSP